MLENGLCLGLYITFNIVLIVPHLYYILMPVIIYVLCVRTFLKTKRFILSFEIIKIKENCVFILPFICFGTLLIASKISLNMTTLVPSQQ